jgi:Tol biopolymer transport system component
MAHRSYISPDKRWAVIVEMQTPVWLRCRVVPLDGSSPGKPIGPDGSCDSAAWAPDGKWIYLTSDGGGSATHLWRVGFPDGVPEQITFGPTGESGEAIAPDGHSLITSVGTAQGTVWLHDDQGDRQISSEGYAYAPYLDEQGTRLTYLEIDRGTRHGLIDKTMQGEQRLISVNIQNGISQEIATGPDVNDYCIPPAGTVVIYADRDHVHRIHLWVSPLDHAVPPKQITPSDTNDSNIICLENGDVVFSRQQKESVLVYRTKPDGSETQRMFSGPILDVVSMSPDGNWLAAHVKVDGGENTRVVIYNLRDGSSRPLCPDCTPLWSPDSKRLYISFSLVTKGDSKERGQTYVIPWNLGSNLGALPPGGIRDEADFAKVAAVVRVAREKEEFAPGPSANTYAYSRRTIQRNLYRIPLL